MSAIDYHSIFINAPYALVILTADGFVRQCNKMAKSIFGLAEDDECKGQKLYEFHAIHPDDRQILAEKISTAQKSYPFFLNFRLSAENGREKTIKAETSLFSEGSESLYMMSFVDVSDEEKMKIEIDSVTHFFNYIVDTSPLVIVLLSNDWQVRVWNSEAERVSGYSKEEVLRENDFLNRLFPDEDYREQVIQLVRDSVRTTEPLDFFDLKITAKSGKEKTLRVSTMRFHDSGKNRLGFNIFGIEVTDRRQVENKLREELNLLESEIAIRMGELQKANDELKLVDQLKTNLLQNVSHELRTPLVAVKGYLDLVHTEKIGSINEQQKNCLGIALKNTNILVDLINELLDFSRFKEGLAEQDLAYVDFKELLTDAQSGFTPKCQAHEVKLSLVLPDKPLPVIGVRKKLHQVIYNLLSNALKFNHPGGSIEMSANQMGDREIEISISDNGIGISTSEQEKIFERFYQASESDEETHQGSGIGLALSKEILRLHGGTIRVISEKGKGSTFSFRLPRVEVSDMPSPSVEIKSQQALEEISGKHKALVIEDDPDTLNFLTEALDLVGIKSVDCTDGRMVLSGAITENIDLIILDLSLPGLDGFEIIDQLRHDPNYSKLPILVVTAQAGRDIEKKVLGSGANGYLLKPFTIDELRDGIKQVFSTR
jgi:PAS domain S-box-containing protein